MGAGASISPAVSCGNDSSLKVWEPGQGLKQVAPHVFGWGGGAAVSPDGTKIAYLAEDAQCKKVPTVANVDGSGTPIALTTGFDCFARPTFGADGALFVEPCTGLSGEVSHPTLDVFQGPAFTRTASIVAAGASLDPTGAYAALVTAGGGVQIVRASDGTVVFRDDAGTAVGPFDRAAAHAYYCAGDALERLDIGTAVAATTLVATGCAGFGPIAPEGFGPIAPDGQHLLFSDRTADAGFPATDAVATAGGAAPVTIRPGAAGLVGLAFTADSTRIVYADALGPGSAALWAVATGGGSPVKLALSNEQFFPLEQSKLVVVTPTSDGLLVDASGAEAPRAFASQVRQIVRASHPAFAYVTAAGIYAML